MHEFSDLWNLPIGLSPTTDRLMPQTADDQQLLHQLARGDEHAFGVVYDRYQRAIHRFAWHMSGDDATAEEITQEVFMLLIRKPGKYDPAKGSLGAYLFGIARNLTRRSLEQRQSTVQLFDETDADENLQDAEWLVNESNELLAGLSQQQMIDRLRKAILSLPAQYREVIVLCDLEQMTQAAVAELLQYSPGTVASRMHRARAMLRMKLIGRGED
jgi:RNA polymerase sigma-70 factor, ECF subfamily